MPSSSPELPSKDIELKPFLEWLRNVPSMRYETPKECRDLLAIFETSRWAKLSTAARFDGETRLQDEAIGNLREAVSSNEESVECNYYDHYKSPSFCDFESDANEIADLIPQINCLDSVSSTTTNADEADSQYNGKYFQKFVIWFYFKLPIPYLYIR